MLPHAFGGSRQHFRHLVGVIVEQGIDVVRQLLPGEDRDFGLADISLDLLEVPHDAGLFLFVVALDGGDDGVDVVNDLHLQDRAVLLQEGNVVVQGLFVLSQFAVLSQQFFEVLLFQRHWTA